MTDDLKKLAEAAVAALTPPNGTPFHEAASRLAGASIAFKDAITAEKYLALIRERDEARAENNRLRAALAVSKSPCVYCQLPADEMAKCKAGFPGCDRADDMMGCAEFGASMEASEQRARAEAAEVALSAAREEVARLRAEKAVLERAVALLTDAINTVGKAAQGELSRDDLDRTMASIVAEGETLKATLATLTKEPHHG